MIQNNRGWSLKEMLFIMAILLFFVLLIAALINNLYSGLTPQTPTKNETSKLTYTEVEKNLVDASKRYYNNHSHEVKSLITSDTLINEKMINTSNMTVNGDVCEGYVIINDKTFTPYIKCTNYETKGY